MTTRLDLKTLKLVEDDLVFDDRKDIELIEDLLEVEQAIERNLTQNIGAWFLNTATGLKKETVIKKNATDAEIFDAVRLSLNQEERVERIEDFNVERTNRTRRITFKAILIDGNLIGVEL